MLTCLVLLGLLVLLPARVEGAPTAPGFSVRTLDGTRRIDSRELIGKAILVLRFQASYCKVCVRESAALNTVTERYRPRGVQVLAIHVQDTATDARNFVRAQRVVYDVALDPRLVIGNRFGFRGTPYTVVIDTRGQMVARIHGASAVARLPKVLDDLLARRRARLAYVPSAAAARSAFDTVSTTRAVPPPPVVVA